VVGKFIVEQAANSSATPARLRKTNKRRMAGE
jgi:hypothetical protein